MHESFTARCEADSVVLMLSAVYGRMRLGRCIRGDYNIGCSTDVVAYFDAHCTGRKSCHVGVRNLIDIHPCQRDFTSYLEASYRCIRGIIIIIIIIIITDKKRLSAGLNSLTNYTVNALQWRSKVNSFPSYTRLKNSGVSRMGQRSGERKFWRQKSPSGVQALSGGKTMSVHAVNITI